MNDLSAVLTRHKLDVDAFYRMAEAGIIGEKDRIELIDGEMIDMAPIGQGHYGSVNRLTNIFVLAFDGRAVVSVQNPLRLSTADEPLPDFTILRWRDDFYGSGERPRPDDVILVVEVADSSLRYDRTVKLELYARSGLAEYWVLDLKRRVVIVHRQPNGDGYDDIRTLSAGATLPLAVDPAIVIDLARILG